MHGDAVFLHDMVVKEIAGVQTMLVYYWDGGYAKLNVENPAIPQFISDTDFAAVDPVRLEVTNGAQVISPGSNGHQAEFTRDDRFFIATDEDFDPDRVTATMGDGTAFTAVQGADAEQIDAQTTLADDSRRRLSQATLAGDTRGGGLACDAASRRLTLAPRWRSSNAESATSR